MRTVLLNQKGLAKLTSGMQEGPESHNVPDMLELKVVAGPCEGQEKSYRDGLALRVGRTKASKVHIKDPSVSERHAEFAWNGTAWTLKDLDSSNGTAVNGNKLESKGQPARFTAEHWTCHKRLPVHGITPVE